MLDICFNDSVGGNLMAAQMYLESDGVLPLNLHLNYGKLSGDVIATQERRTAENLLYYFPNTPPKEIDRNYEKGLRLARQCFKDLEDRLKNEQSLRVWVSNTAQDRCNLYWLCNFAKSYQPKISIVVCPGYEFNSRKNCYVENRNWASFTNHRFMADCAKNAVELTEEEIGQYAKAWEKLVEKDAPLRVLIDDDLVSTDADFFDAVILRHISDTPKSQSSILGNFLSEYIGMDVDFVCSRIDFLLKNNLIKVCEEKVDTQGCCWSRTISIA